FQTGASILAALIIVFGIASIVYASLPEIPFTIGMRISQFYLFPFPVENDITTMTKRCCCGIFSITTGAQILAALMVLGAVGSIISVCIPDAHHTTGTRIGTGVSSALELVVGALVFVACRKQRASLMTPMLAYAAISLFCIAVFFILCVYGLFDQHSVVPNWIRFLLEQHDEMTTIAPIIADDVITTTEEPLNPEQYVFVITVVFTLFTAICFAFAVWYFNVYHKCYKHLRELESTRAYSQYEA
ncbi:hypothetical protein PENTCL1PPCAC_14499, partial [Pristionchus entomophagus]